MHLDSHELIDNSSTVSFKRAAMQLKQERIWQTYKWYYIALLICPLAYIILTMLPWTNYHVSLAWGYVNNKSILVASLLFIGVLMVKKFLTIPSPSVNYFPYEHIMELRRFLPSDFSPMVEKHLAKVLDRAYEYVEVFYGEDEASIWAKDVTDRVKVSLNRHTGRYKGLYKWLEDYHRDHAILGLAFLTELYRTIEPYLVDNTFGSPREKMQDFWYRICKPEALFELLSNNAYRLLDFGAMVYNEELRFNKDDHAKQILSPIQSNEFSLSRLKIWILNALEVKPQNTKETWIYTIESQNNCVYLTQEAIDAFTISTKQKNIKKAIKESDKPIYINNQRVYCFEGISIAHKGENYEINYMENKVKNSIVSSSEHGVKKIDKERFNSWVDDMLIKYLPNSNDQFFYVDNHDLRRIIITEKCLNQWLMNSEGASIGDLLNNKIISYPKMKINNQIIGYLYRKQVKDYVDNNPQIGRASTDEMTSNSTVKNNEVSLWHRFIKSVESLLKESLPNNLDDKYFAYNPKHGNLLFITERGMDKLGLTQEEIQSLITDKKIIDGEYRMGSKNVYAIEYKVADFCEPYLSIKKK